LPKVEDIKKQEISKCSRLCKELLKLNGFFPAIQNLMLLSS